MNDTMKLAEMSIELMNMKVKLKQINELVNRVIIHTMDQDITDLDTIKELSS